MLECSPSYFTRMEELQMDPQLTDRNDIKIFVLYLLDNIHYPLDFDTINDIVVQDEFVGYFDFAECFAELLDAGHIREEVTNGVALYRITETGSEVAVQLQSSLLAPIREKSLKSALRILSFQKSKAEVKCNVEKREDGRYDFSCSITQNKVPTMQLSMVIDSHDRAQKMKSNFLDRPEVVYKGILAMTACEVDYLFD